jgi:N-acetylmuramoyl-L-alanine amidase
LTHTESWQRLRRIGALFSLLAVAALPASGRTGRSEAWAREQYAAAEHLREALNGRPAQERSRSDYQRVINAYRRVYYGSPASAKASPSVAAVAELLVDMGRQFNDDKLLRSAVGQYQFLRREYPGSKYRFEGLFTIGEIYKNDLHDPRQARQVFEEFLKKYPHHHLAEQARSGIAGLEKTAEAPQKVSAKEKPGQSAQEDAEAKSAAEPAGKVGRVTGVRHWSTPGYTRVAIDLERDVKFDSSRLDHPERIFFDLYDTNLASTLAGKTFDVEDGFLKKIRIAQFEPGRTRVVLEVDDLAEYNAFLLPNPSRLIIDVRGQESARSAGKDAAPPRSDFGLQSAENAAPAEDENDETIKVVKVDSKTGAKAERKRITTSAGKAIPKKVVEADSDDDAAAPEAKAAEKASEKKSTAAQRPTSPAVSTHRKRRAADGNNDEIATLDPLDTKLESKAASTRVSSPAARRKGKLAAKPAEPEFEAREAQPTASGDRSLIRALGLKIGRIVIDPGHGGHDTGTIGPNGLQEKDLVLDVGKRLGKLLEARLGADVIYTRQDDIFIPLETRTAIANQEQADLFVSIHANSSHDPDARGVETYYLNFTSNSDALEVAARENAVSDKSIHELQDLVKKIALKEKIEESREFASDVQRSLHSGLAMKSPGLRDRGVKKAPFIVLIGANMPSILAEISFVSNPTDARKLRTAEYRQRIAESLYKGISKYASGLSGVKVASGVAKNEGQ